MKRVARINCAFWLVAFSLLGCGFTALAQRVDSSVSGQVKDQAGAIVLNASVSLVDAAGREQKTTTNRDGVYLFEKLAPGQYRLMITAQGFSKYENNEVVVKAAQRETIDVQLSILIEEKVAVTTENGMGVDPDNNANSLVLRGKDLGFLPDDPDELASVLRAFAGAAAGPDGVEILVDGFSGVRNLPRRSQISEIRINQNPFTAEYDRIGFGRIDLRLSSTTQEFHGEAEFYFNDESLNSRNPYAVNRAPFQVRNYSFSLSGPLIKNRASFYAAIAREETDGNAVINATVLDDQLRITPFGVAVLVPERELYSDVRTDFKLNENNNLTFNYQYLPNKQNAAGVGGFNLPSRAYDVLDRTHIFRAISNSVLSPAVFNQLRFQFIWNLNRIRNANTDPTLNVLQAFTGGGANVNNDRTDTKRFELSDNVTFGLGNRTLRFGGRVRAVKITDISPFNFNGTYIFSGGEVPVLDQNNQIVNGPNGQPLLIEIDSLERYRRTLFFQDLGLSPEDIRLRGGGASQFSIAGGDPKIGVTQYDVGVYAQYDWRMSPSFNLGLGLRYESQTNISSNLNFAPRVSFAWAPGAGGKNPTTTVVRGGFGVFYLRFNELFTLQTNQFDGVTQQQFIINDPDILNLFPAVPPASVLQNLNTPQTTKIVEPSLRTPYSYQAALSIERQLPRRTTFSATVVSARYLHLLRSRNINAPLPGSFDPNVPDSGIAPIPGGGNIYQFESSGWLNQTQLILTLNSRLNPRMSIYANYTLNRSRSDTNGATWFPANSYDLSDEYGRSGLDVRNRFTAGGNFNGPWGVTINPLVVARSGLPFNITTGLDTNGDTLFTERPSFATGSFGPNIVNTRFGSFNTDPAPGQTLIPLNYATGPAFLSVNMRFTKNYAFGPAPMIAEQGKPAKKGDPPYTLTMSVSFQNIFNRNNPAVPIGNLSSRLFGQSNASATEAGAASPNNNRRINLSVSLEF